MIYFFLILAAFAIAGYFLLRDRGQTPTNTGGSGGGSEKTRSEDNTTLQNNEETL
ncbi:hypothetical protein [Pedobacter aquatilis]|uniref:hypothetical protein n=1 Tax=Pedobacter aquatilis TaxID=351343 RepID=UPI002930AB4B|nr:hypothetical protein [Pedobacter aquatilis]